MHKWNEMAYERKIGVSIISAYIEIWGDSAQAIDNYGRRDFWYKKVLSKSIKTYIDPDERIFWGREFKLGFMEDLNSLFKS
jgi:hypothetical protein